MIANVFDLDVIASIKASIAAKKAREEKVIQNLEEARARAYEKHKSYFYDELENFVRKIPKRLDNGEFSMLRDKIFIGSARLPFHPIDDDIKINVDDFVRKMGMMIRSDPRFTTKREQLLSETGIDLDFTNFEYWDEDESLEQYPNDIAEQFKNGSFIFDAILSNS